MTTRINGLTRWTAISCFVCICITVPDIGAETKRPWSSVIAGHPLPSNQGVSRFVLLEITQDTLHLVGRCVYDNAVIENSTPKTITIDGFDTGKAFWPDVLSQVGNNTSKWETIAHLPSHSHHQTVTVLPGNAKFDLKVNLDIFQPLIGKYTFGRVVLKTGDAAVFELKELLPPQEDR